VDASGRLGPVPEHALAWGRDSSAQTLLSYWWCCFVALAGSKLKPPGLQVAGSTAPFTVGLSPQAESERAAWLAEERARQEAFQQAETAKMRRTIEDQLRVELNDVLAKNSFSWREAFCCCFPKKTVSAQLQHPSSVTVAVERIVSHSLLMLSWLRATVGPDCTANVQ